MAVISEILSHTPNSRQPDFTLHEISHHTPHYFTIVLWSRMYPVISLKMLILDFHFNSNLSYDLLIYSTFTQENQMLLNILASMHVLCIKNIQSLSM